ncbi:sensor histidine kinase [Tenacibaculum larymnensis]|uniref:Histidine kinase n=1 Tax=Tenacibaculum larymnensis TaxID=2878201 RepID=A0A9X4EQC8_9FLAO|nr:histidine kinase [Tenacibaculum larymnensis]MDE1208273.1 histidine kinase [Tenacibaculum larymnensis]
MEVTSFLWHIVIANLTIFFIISLFIYKNIKEEVFKYYAVFKFFLLFYLIIKSGNIITPELNYLRPLNWGIQVVYNIYLSYFGISFLKLQNYFPKTIKHIRYILKNVLIGSSILCFITIVFSYTIFYFYFFTFIYLPFHLLISFYLLYLASKTQANERIYYFLGTLSYIVFASIAFILTITQNIYIGAFSAVSFFYIGILIEEYSFGYGLSEKIKKIYYDKLTTERKLTLAQKKINKHLKSEVDKIKIEKQVKDLKFIVMNSKMNSHFIFNALNSIKHYIIKSDRDNAINYLGEFSEFIRNILEIDPTKMISLEKELNNINLYVSLENMRFNNEIKLKTIVNYGISLENTKVPPFILQPFIENAIWHGLASKKNKNIKLIVEQQNDNIVISITDNGIGRKKASKLSFKRESYKKSMGIDITKNILKNFYENNFSINFLDLYDNKAPIGTKVIIEIPK